MQSASTLKDWPFTHRLQTLTALPRGHRVDRLGQEHKPGVGLLASMRISGPGHLQDSAQGGGESEGAGHCTFQLGPPGGITWIDHSTASLAGTGSRLCGPRCPGGLLGDGKKEHLQSPCTHRCSVEAAHSGVFAEPHISNFVSLLHMCSARATVGKENLEVSLSDCQALAHQRATRLSRTPPECPENPSFLWTPALSAPHPAGHSLLELTLLQLADQRLESHKQRDRPRTEVILFFRFYLFT